MIEALLLLARHDGIGVTLTPLSKAIVAGTFLLVLGAVLWVVSHRKADGAAYTNKDPNEDRQ